MNIESLLPYWPYVAIIALIVAAVYFIRVAHVAGKQVAITQITALLDAIRGYVQEADKLINATDKARYQYVSQKVHDWLFERGVSFDADKIEQMIEGAVKLVHRAQDKQINQ